MKIKIYSKINRFSLYLVLSASIGALILAILQLIKGEYLNFIFLLLYFLISFWISFKWIKKINAGGFEETIIECENIEILEGDKIIMDKKKEPKRLLKEKIAKELQTAKDIKENLEEFEEVNIKVIKDEEATKL